MKNYILFPVVLNLFAGNANVQTTATTGSGNDLSPEMKTYYSDYLIDMAEPELVHDQFGQKHPVPKNGGKTIEFRKYSPLPAIPDDMVLTEGVTPDGQNLDVTVVESTVEQYGGYVTLSDMLLLTAIDNNLVQATQLIGSQAGRVADIITREVINGGTNVQYAEGQVSSRSALTKDHVLTVNAIRRAVRKLKVMNAPTINGYYAGIIHPDCSYDLMNDEKWVNVKTYSDPEDIYTGEIGRIERVRFVETSEAKVFEKAGASGANVYSTLIVGANAYGVTEITGGGLRHIVKQLGSGGTEDPLEQRATVGWKLAKTAEILVDEYMVRIETGSSFS
jgi:N4-gp56 family major capsid protein